MKRFWLKITGSAIFVLATIIGVYILWPAKSPDTGNIPYQDKKVLTTQTDREKPQLKRHLKPEDFQTAASSKFQNPQPRINHQP